VKIFVLGGSGFLGWNLISDIRWNHEIYSTYFNHPFELGGVKSIYFDINDFQSLETEIIHFNPDLIINCAGLSKISPCRHNPALAFKLNCESVYKLAILCEKLKIKLIHFSTDLVYSGDSSPYNENSETIPKSIYGKTKLLSENIIKSFSSDFVILRASLLYGWGNKHTESFVDWLSSAAKENRDIRLYYDQFRSMFYVKDAAKVIDSIIGSGIKNQIFNLGGFEKISRYEFGVKFFELFYPNNRNIIKSSVKDECNAEQLGIDCTMNISKLEQLLDFKPRCLIEGLDDMKNTLQGKELI